VARAGAIGVDLERCAPLGMSSRRREEILAVAAGLAAAPMGDPASDEALLRAWCLLEAFAKARGEGLSHVLTELGLRHAGGRQLALNQIAAAARRLARRSGLEIADVRTARAACTGRCGCRPHSIPCVPAAFPRMRDAIRRILSRAVPSPVDRHAPAGAHRVHRSGA
jgi:hypothetical protein